MTDKPSCPTIADVLHNAADALQPKKNICATNKDIGRLEAEILLAYALKENRTWLLTHPYYKLRTSSYTRFRYLIARRKRHEPIAYILRKKDFYGRTFRVTNAVLIPRPETEQIIDIAKTADPLVIWDVGTGSGCIAVTLAIEFPNAHILATDTSSRALAVARSNAKKWNTTNITFKKCNLLDHTALDWFDVHPAQKSHFLITANLPYLPIKDTQKLAPDIVQYEPAQALYGGSCGSELIEKLLRQIAAISLNMNIIFECDPPEALRLARLARSLFPHARVCVSKDLARRNRILLITPNL